MKTKPRNQRLVADLARGEKAIAQDRVVTHQEARKRLARWLK
jgi:predicted transcriptional regulator